MKTIGIAAHSFEGGTLCFITACREGAVHLGPDMHPTVVMSAVPMGLSLPGWDNDDHELVAKYLSEGVQLVADAGADFFICPDNTAHIVLEQVSDALPIPGLHIARVVCSEIASRGWKRVGLLGTKWTMTGPVYARELESRGMERLTPEEPARERMNTVIMDELCRSKFEPESTRFFIDAIDDLKSRGAECVILGCTEIPLIIDQENSSLPVLDSTRLLAKYAVMAALEEGALNSNEGWLD